MLIYFHQNRAKYDKGQLIPFFIFILVVIIIMALVTVNISKVAFFKTESSNAADAGGLAAGSVMSTVFNSLAQANSSLESAYWEMYAAASVSFALAITLLVTTSIILQTTYTTGLAALETACSAPCPAVFMAGEAGAQELIAHGIYATIFVSLILGLMVTVIAFSIAQYYYYLDLRKAAQSGRLQAMGLGFKFAFINSNIGNKLKEGEPPGEEELKKLMQGIIEQLVENISDPALRADPNIRDRILNDPAIEEQLHFKQRMKNNYRNLFSRFMENIKVSNADDSGPTLEDNMQGWTDVDGKKHQGYDYEWIDGSGRQHSIKTEISINPIDTFRLQSTVLPWGAIVGLLSICINLAMKFLYMVATGLLSGACACWSCMNNPFSGAFCAACYGILCALATIVLVAAVIANLAASNGIIMIFAVIMPAWLGLLPGAKVTNSDGDCWDTTICWIDDIVHDRKVRVDTWQEHQGAEFGLWRTSYPLTHSFSVVDFNHLNRGRIYPPVLRHDSSIVQVDSGEEIVDECWDVRGRVSELHAQEGQQQELISTYNDLISTLTDQIAKISNYSEMQRQIAELNAQKNNAIAQLGAATNKLQDLEKEINQLKAAHPDCFL